MSILFYFYIFYIVDNRIYKQIFIATQSRVKLPQLLSVELDHSPEPYNNDAGSVSGA